MNTTNYSNSNINMNGIVPLYLKILASIFYIFSIILGIGGNTLVLLVVIHFRRIKNVTNFFILSLAISDLIFIILCVPSTYVTAYLIQYWPFSNILCVFLNYMQNVSVTLVVYTLIWMTLDKFLALVRPLKQQRLTIKASKYLILLTWLFSLFISLPIALFTKLVYNTNTNINNNINNNNNNLTNNIIEQLPQCLEMWPDHLANYTQIYNLFLLFAQYFIPLLILSFCYIKIGLVLKRLRAPGEIIESRDAVMLKSRKKMLKMCFILVLSFVVSWAPMQFITVIRFFDDSLTMDPYFGDIFFICHSIAVSRSFMNPFIYAWTNAKFRLGFKYFLCYLCIKKKTSSSLLLASSTNHHNNQQQQHNNNNNRFEETINLKTFKKSFNNNNNNNNNIVKYYI
jgi:hypothetical protein